MSRKAVEMRQIGVSMPEKVLFTSDIHGNTVQYKKLVDYAIAVSADIIIIGGDIAPKNHTFCKCTEKQEVIENQRYFFEGIFQEIFSKLKYNLPDSKTFLMTGNDDCSVNSDVLEIGEPELYQIIHGKRIQISKDYDIVGYSPVPITPFGIKDWEKFDLSEVPAGLKDRYIERKRTTYRYDGLKSIKAGFREFQFSPDMEKEDSIQKDLSDAIYTRNPERTIYVIHTPPDKTNLDMTLYRGYVGSMAVRLFIEKYQPYLTLHGHIHETVDVSGNFRDKIGRTLSLSSGNYDISDKLAVIVFDIDRPEDAERMII